MINEKEDTGQKKINTQATCWFDFFELKYTDNESVRIFSCTLFSRFVNVKTIIYEQELYNNVKPLQIWLCVTHSINVVFAGNMG